MLLHDLAPEAQVVGLSVGRRWALCTVAGRIAELWRGPPCERPCHVHSSTEVASAINVVAVLAERSVWPPGPGVAAAAEEARGMDETVYNLPGVATSFESFKAMPGH